MKKALEIRELINTYKAFKRLKEMLIEKNKGETVSYYKFYEIPTLRELVKIRRENPMRFRVACALDKYFFVLN
jgi:hypothetical protein